MAGWEDQHVPFSDWLDVHERRALVVAIDKASLSASRQDFAKDAFNLIHRPSALRAL